MCVRVCVTSPAKTVARVLNDRPEPIKHEEMK